MKRVLAFLIPAGFVCGGALAQDEALVDGLYWRVGAGASFNNDLNQDFTYNPNAPIGPDTPPANQTVALSSGLTAALALGFDYADGIRTELEYRYAQTDVDSVTPAGAVSASPGIDPNAPQFPDERIKAHLLMSNFYFDFYTDGPFAPFIGGGVGGAFVTNENGDRDAALAYQGRAGVAVKLGEGFSLDVEYIYLRTNDLVYGPLDEEFNAAGSNGPRIDGDHYQSSSVMASFRKKF